MRGGMNPRKMKKAMKKMGMEQEEIEASKVIIVQEDKRLVFDKPEVKKVNMMGQESYQVVGDYTAEEVSEDVEINDDDIQTVVDQTGASEEEAQQALEQTDGDIAEAIMDLQG